MNVLLIGGAGYIGTHVALEFLQRGDSIGVFDDLSSGLRENIHPDATFYEGTILDYQLLLSVCQQRKWDAVIHLAANKAAGESMITPQKFSVNNITGSLNIIMACVEAGIPYFVLSSSAAVYGEPNYLPIDELHPTNPENYYGYTKLAIERHLSWYDRLKNLKFASLRYFNAAGYDPDGKMTGLERAPANLIPVVMEVAIGKRPVLQVFGDDYPTPDGTGVRDYIHVKDLAIGHVMALDHIRSTQQSITVNLGSEEGLSVMEIVNAARRISGRAIPVNIAPRRAGDPARLVASSRLARESFGWTATCSSLESIIQTTWNVYKDHIKH